jgi:hypothetical protein
MPLETPIPEKLLTAIFLVLCAKVFAVNASPATRHRIDFLSMVDFIL